MSAPDFFKGTDAEYEALLDATIERSTKASGVPLRVEDPTVLDRVARIVHAPTGREAAA